MSSVAGKISLGARRVLRARVSGGAIELGAPPRWPAAEHERVLAEARKLQRARARDGLRRIVALTAVGVVVLMALGVGVLPALAGAVLLLAGRWCLTAMTIDTPVVLGWARWVRARRVLERELRLLGAEWRLLWDRRVPGLPAPGIVAVGPSGVWGLWLPEPGPTPSADLKTTSEALSEETGIAAGAYMLTVPEQQFVVFVQEMACAPRAASPGDIARAAERLDSTLLQEPVLVEGGTASMIGSRKRDRERTAREVWVRAVRIAEAAGAVSPGDDPRLARRVLQICRDALADVFEALWAREPAAAQPSLVEAGVALQQWWDRERERWDQERGERCPPGSGVAHVLLAPSLAELTLANSHGDSVDLAEMTAAAQTPSQRTLLALVIALGGGASGREVTLGELLELDATDLRYALEGIAVDRSLWPVRRDLRWLHAAIALRGDSESGG